MKKVRALKIALLSLVLIFAFCVTALAGDYFVGSIHSNKYHYPGCPAAQRIKPENLVVFRSANEARAAGYVPCKICNPPLYGQVEDDGIGDYNPDNYHAVDNPGEYFKRTGVAPTAPGMIYDPVTQQMDVQDPATGLGQQAIERAKLKQGMDVNRAAQSKEGVLSESSLANYLASVNNFDIEDARRHGYTDAQIIDYLENNH